MPHFLRYMALMLPFAVPRQALDFIIDKGWDLSYFKILLAFGVILLWTLLFIGLTVWRYTKRLKQNWPRTKNMNCISTKRSLFTVLVQTTEVLLVLSLKILLWDWKNRSLWITRYLSSVGLVNQTLSSFISIFHPVWPPEEHEIFCPLDSGSNALL